MTTNKPEERDMKGHSKRITAAIFSGLSTLCVGSIGVSAIATAVAASLASDVAYAGATLTAPSVSNGEYVNGVLFTATVTSDVAKVELSANNFLFGTLNAANSWSLRYTFSSLGSRDIAAKAYNSAGTLLNTSTITINVMDALIESPKKNTTFLNGTAVTVAASTAVTQVILKAETFEVGRSSTRNANGKFVIMPAIMGTTGARTFNAEAYNSAGTKLTTYTAPVTVYNVDVLSPAAGSSYASGATITGQVQAASNVAKIDYFADANLIGSSTDAATMFKRDFTLANGGSRVIKAVAYNSAGANIGEDSTTITVTGVTPPTCQFSAWTTYNGVSLRKHSSGAYLYKTSHKQIDADGAPNAYHPADVGKTCSATAGLKGLDCPANAGYPNGSFWRDVLAVDPSNSNKPYVQPSGPFAGYFVSMTSLVDSSKASTDIARYVSSTAFPYIVFPGAFAQMTGTGKRGDLGYAINLGDTTKKTHFVVAETGPTNALLGEMSIELARRMGGNNPNPINGAGAPSGTILYVSFPFSGNTYTWPRTNTQMGNDIQTLLSSVGGEAGILACKDL
jgi:hypothetical protein